jgi:acyl carrier protein
MRGDLDNTIRVFLRTELGVTGVEIDSETALVTTGLIDSAGLVRLAALLEDETGVRIPDRDIHAEHFDSIARIHAYLARLGVRPEDAAERQKAKSTKGSR